VSYRVLELKDGKRVVEFRCTIGRDPETGKQITRQSRWRVPSGWSDNAILKEATKRDVLFQKEAHEGKILSKAEQKEAAKHAKEDAEKKRSVYDSIPSFRQYCDEMYFPALEAEETALGTIALKKQRLSVCDEAFANTKMCEITRQMVQRVIYPKIRSKELQYNTKKSYYNAWRGVFQKAVEDGVIEESPMKDEKPPVRRKNAQAAAGDKKKSCTAEEITYLLKCLENEKIQKRTLMILLIYCGIRRGEAAGLKWEHLNLETGEITIHNNIQCSRGFGVYETATKTGRTRTFMLAPEAVTALRLYRKEVIKRASLEGKIPSQYCFPNRNGGPINPDLVTEWVSDFGKKYGMEGLHPHMFRHSFATLLAEQDVNPAVVSAILGHANASTTLNVYTHVSNDRLKIASRSFGEIIRDAKQTDDVKPAKEA